MTLSYYDLVLVELLVYLGVGAHPVVLPRDLYCRNFSLLEAPFHLITTVFYRVSVGFPFGSSLGF
jgi:hypothetical protein